jgi:hypothetical protein
MKTIGLLLLCLCVACGKKPAPKTPAPEPPAAEPAEPKPDSTTREAPKGDPCDGGEDK